MKTIALCASIFLFLASCGNPIPDESDNGGDQFPGYTLEVVDSIGIEIGDSAFVFGAIADVEILPDGNIAVLDGTYCNIRIFSSRGEYIRTISGRGEGPGELLHPFYLFNWGDGTLGVLDPYLGGIERFSITGEWLGQDLAIHGNIHIDPIVMNDSQFVSFKSRFDVSGDAVNATGFVGLFPMSENELYAYWTKTVLWDPGNMANLAMEFFFSNFCTADRNTGRVFICPFAENEYTIHCYNLDGTEAGTITREYTPILKTAEEIQAEKDFISFFLRSSENNNPDFNFNCDPRPYHLAVSGLYIGPEGNLWARRGGMEVPTFDVWNRNLEFAGTVSIPAMQTSGASWKMVFGSDFIVAWDENPNDFQKLYIIEIR